jgi:hypothetical protein
MPPPPPSPLKVVSRSVLIFHSSHPIRASYTIIVRTTILTPLEILYASLYAANAAIIMNMMAKKKKASLGKPALLTSIFAHSHTDRSTDE